QGPPECLDMHELPPHVSFYTAHGQHTLTPRHTHTHYTHTHTHTHTTHTHTECKGISAESLIDSLKQKLVQIFNTANSKVPLTPAEMPTLLLWSYTTVI